MWNILIILIYINFFLCTKLLPSIEIMCRNSAIY